MRKKQVILLKITDFKKWDYLAVKILPVLLRGIKSKLEGDFHCLNCFHSYSTKSKLKKLCNVCKNHDYCCVEIPNEDNKILKCNHGEKYMKIPFVIDADLKC